LPAVGPRGKANITPPSRVGPGLPSYHQDRVLHLFLCLSPCSVCSCSNSCPGKRYIAKMEEMPVMEQKPGRYWEKTLPIGKREDLEVTTGEAVKLRRFMRRYRVVITPLRNGSACAIPLSVQNGAEVHHVLRGAPDFGPLARRARASRRTPAKADA